MRRIDIGVDNNTYSLIKQHAEKQGISLSEAARALIKIGLTTDAPEKDSQAQLTCSVESLILLRKLADLRSHQLVIDANREAKQEVKRLHLQGEI